MKDSHLITTWFWLTFMVMNLILTLVFAVLRLPIMNESHFYEARRSVGGFGDALYISVMHQSTIGDSHIVPLSPAARAISVVQSFTIILIYGATIYILYSRLSK